WGVFILLVLVSGVDGGGFGFLVTGLVGCQAGAGNGVEPPEVDQVVTQETTFEGSASTVPHDPLEGSYRSALPVSRATIAWLAGLIRAYRARIGSRWRKASPGRQAVLVLAMLRKDERLADLAGPHAVSASTLRRWLLEVIGLLAARAPRLDRVVRRLAARGVAVVLVDGTLLRTRRRTGRQNRANFSGKHKHHGLNALGITDERGRLVWVSAVLPGKIADITAARHHRVREWLHRAGLTPAGDKGFHGWHKDVRGVTECDWCEGPCAQVVLTPYKAERNHPLTQAQKTANGVFNAMRCAVEGGFAALKTWRILDKLRLHSRHATTLVRALLVLLQHEQATRDTANTTPT
uniref:transposase family protein n=1 Tax=Amycolatopsis anabasis TaxID=1840409 RepID=UPI001C550627